MKIRRMFMGLLFLCWLPASGLALEVPEAVITTKITDRTPADSIQTYPASVGRLFCFTQVKGAVGEMSIVHVWYHEGAEKARIELPVRSADWRTWSEKKIDPGSAGEWKVDILDAEGKLLQSVSFGLN